MALPEHKYYSLKQAAKKAGCEVEDLIHFAAIGILQLCIKIPTYGFYTQDDDGSEAPVDLLTRFFYDPNKVPDEYKTDDNKPFCSYESEYFSSTDQITFTGDKSINVSGMSIYGLLAINYYDLYEVEQEFISGDRSLYVTEFGIPRCKTIKHPAFYTVHGMYVHDLVEVPLDSLVITAYELKLLLSGGQNTEPDLETNKLIDRDSKRRENFSKQKASLIRSLTELAFAKDGGISNLSMESLSTQLQGKFKANGIEHEDVSPANIRNWIGKPKVK